MSSIGNNINAEYSNLRDSFFDSGEKEYLQELLKEKKDKLVHEILLKKDSSFLYKKAKNLINQVEEGRFNDEQMEDVEYMITHLLSAIEDIEKEKQKEFFGKGKTKETTCKKNYKQDDEEMIR